MMCFMARKPDPLVEAISLLAHHVCELTELKRTEFDWLKSHVELATKCDLKEMENRIMSVISDFLTKQEDYNKRHGAAIDSLVTSVGGLTGDVEELNRQIKELQDSSGGVTPEDQARIDAIQATGEELAAKLEGASNALTALDAATPPRVPPPPPPA